MLLAWRSPVEYSQLSTEPDVGEDPRLSYGAALCILDVKVICFFPILIPWTSMYSITSCSLAW